MSMRMRKKTNHKTLFRAILSLPILKMRRLMNDLSRSITILFTLSCRCRMVLNIYKKWKMGLLSVLRLLLLSAMGSNKGEPQGSLLLIRPISDYYYYATNKGFITQRDDILQKAYLLAFGSLFMVWCHWILWGDKKGSLSIQSPKRWFLSHKINFVTLCFRPFYQKKKFFFWETKKFSVFYAFWTQAIILRKVVRRPASCGQNFNQEKFRFQIISKPFDRSTSYLVWW